MWRLLRLRRLDLAAPPPQDYVRPDEVPALQLDKGCFDDLDKWPVATAADRVLSLASAEPTMEAAGRATSLYDLADPQTGRRSGDPVADKYCAVVGKGFAWLAVADGVNWGDKAALAAKSAVEGATDGMAELLKQHRQSARRATTRDVANWLMQAIFAAQQRIIGALGTLTTLCCGLVVRLRNKHLAFVCANVGDSRAYLVPAEGIPVHVTEDHTLRSNLRDAGGALGFANGEEPDLSNLRFFVQSLAAGDVLFLCTDGVHDNLDPEIRMEVPTPVDPYLNRTSVEAAGMVQAASTDAAAEERAVTKATHISKHLQRLRDSFTPPSSISAAAFMEVLHAELAKLTEAQRTAVETAELYTTVAENPEQQAMVNERKKQLNVTLASLPGKMDHATVLAVRILP